MVTTGGRGCLRVGKEGRIMFVVGNGRGFRRGEAVVCSRGLRIWHGYLESGLKYHCHHFSVLETVDHMNMIMLQEMNQRIFGSTPFPNHQPKSNILVDQA